MTDPIAMTNPQRAAAMFIAMGKQHASKLIKYFKNEELRILIDAAHTLPTISRSLLDELVKRFEDDFSAGTGLFDSSETFDSIISESFTPEEFSALINPQIEKEEGAEEVPLWDTLETIDSDEIIEFIQDEHPQTWALILSKLSSRKAAEIVETLERDKRKSVIRRMLALGEPAPAALSIIERHLRDQFINTSRGADSSVGHARVANVLNELDRTHMEELLGDLETEADPDNIAAVKSLLFRFEDIVNLDASARSTIFDSIATDLVAVSLRDAEGDLSEAVLSSLGQRTRRMIESELAAESAVKPEAVAQARRDIASAAIKLAAEGRIVMPAAQEAA